MTFTFIFTFYNFIHNLIFKIIRLVLSCCLFIPFNIKSVLAKNVITIIVYYDILHIITINCMIKVVKIIQHTDN